MAQFHKSRHRPRPRPRPRILPRLPIGKQVPVLTNDPSRCISPRESDLCKWSQSPKSIDRPRLPRIEVGQNSSRAEDPHVVAESHRYSDVPVLKIATWDCTVTLSTVATVGDDGRLHVHHLALVSVATSMQQLYAEKVSLSFVVCNALRTNRKCSLVPGQSSLLFKEDVSQCGFYPRQGAELIIVRHRCDLEKPLSLYFAFTYPSSQHFIMASLPTLRPKQGRSLSEIVFIAEPRLPLSMRTYVRDPLSSWKLRHHPVNQVTCYERTNSSPLCPAGSRDGIQMTLLELNLVRFQALQGFSLASVIWKLDITIQSLPTQQSECRMSFFVDVGAATAIVSLNSHDWVPQYFIIDGCVATEEAGECWKSKDGDITIFKQDHMGPGPILIETYWRSLPEHGHYDIYGPGDLSLPVVADSKVLGGRLACQAKNSTYRCQRVS